MNRPPTDWPVWFVAVCVLALLIAAYLLWSGRAG